VKDFPSPAMDRLDRIELRGLRALGTHGVLPEERDRPQPFEVDLDLEMDLRAAGRSDLLGDTADYGAIAEAVVAVIAGPHSDLLEHLAERIAQAALTAGAGSAGATGVPRATGVRVAVRKLRPPVGVAMTSAGVNIHRRPSEAGQAGAPREPGQSAATVQAQ
jgi:7,8-dihydroneopterin aldolase/epimerase/oxygenase